MSRLSMDSICSSAATSLPKCFQRMIKPTTPATTDKMMRAKKSTNETVSPAKAWTDCTKPLRVMKVPKITKLKVMQAHMMLQRLKVPRLR